MSDRITDLLILIAAIGAGIVAGIFFAFSSFVMAALGRIPPESGVAAMQSINITVINPGFMSAFMGTGLVCLALMIGAFWTGGANLALILVAGALYIIGCIGVTMACNVPLNDALAAVQPGTPAAAELWSRYLRDWTFWNHIRTAAPLASAILFVLALR